MHNVTVCCSTRTKRQPVPALESWRPSPQYDCEAPCLPTVGYGGLSTGSGASKHFSSSSGYYQECRVQTTQSLAVLGRFRIKRLLFVSVAEIYLGESNFSHDEDIICTANSWFKEKEELFWYSGICALKKPWTKCATVAGNYVENWQTVIYIRVYVCRFLRQATKFERPS